MSSDKSEVSGDSLEMILKKQIDELQKKFISSDDDNRKLRSVIVSARLECSGYKKQIEGIEQDFQHVCSDRTRIELILDEKDKLILAMSKSDREKEAEIIDRVTISLAELFRKETTVMKSQLSAMSKIIQSVKKTVVGYKYVH